METQVTNINTNNRSVAVVTGAASGIGLATAEALHLAGYQVFGTSRKARAGSPAEITMLECDVTNRASVATMVTHAINQAGRIDVFVNNAGSALIGGAEESSVEQAQALFDLNVFGIVRVTNEVLPIRRRQRSGRIINISSVVGFIPGPFSALYAATKHAVEGYSESLDHEGRSLGVRVLLVEPAFTNTALDHNATQPDRVTSVYDQGRKTIEAVWKSAIEAGDAPELVAEAVVRAAMNRPGFAGDRLV